MTQWEYLTRIFTLDKEDEVVVDYIQTEYPDRSWKEMPKYAPLTLEAWLSREGWELVSLVPAEMAGKQGDLGRGYNTATWNWAHHYLCVFKRQVEK